MERGAFGKIYKCADNMATRKGKCEHLESLKPKIRPIIIAYLVYRIILCGGRCEFTAIPFDFAETCSNPSPERIDNAIGYRGGNMQIICAAFNVAPHMLGDSPRFPIEYFYTATDAATGSARREQIDAALAHDKELLRRLIETEFTAEWSEICNMAARFPE